MAVSRPDLGLSNNIKNQKKNFFDQKIKKKNFKFFERFLFTDMFYRVCSSHCTSLGGQGLVKIQRLPNIKKKLTKFYKILQITAII